jgi:hypothetical protein
VPWPMPSLCSHPPQHWPTTWSSSVGLR